MPESAVTLDRNTHLPQALREAEFKFRGEALTGAKTELPRWQKATSDVNQALGEAIGKLYVARHFPPIHKARMQTLVGNLMAAYKDSINGLDWMSAATKAEAQDKLSKYVTKIGSPDKWRDYSRLEVRAGDAFGNSERAARFQWERMIAKAGKPVDRAEWWLTPQTVNAYYSAQNNEIVFPAAILQPPFFDMNVDGSTASHIASMRIIAAARASKPHNRQRQRQRQRHLRASPRWPPSPRDASRCGSRSQAYALAIGQGRRLRAQSVPPVWAQARPSVWRQRGALRPRAPSDAADSR